MRQILPLRQIMPLFYWGPNEMRAVDNGGDSSKREKTVTKTEVGIKFA
ncbi:hypothetical protein J2S00_001019 [Caldalkalibacillus uzonensis]|uniref:Uncharacterized protein n=1 Tax=Caldalkalibacillus uzonensis TaxID=353224 RepID=A0ABU0CRV0_9BACI|nr:hypothetical protein [Caldalkalibacillus uzonensis]